MYRPFGIYIKIQTVITFPDEWYQYLVGIISSMLPDPAQVCSMQYGPTSNSKSEAHVYWGREVNYLL